MMPLRRAAPGTPALSRTLLSPASATRALTGGRLSPLPPTSREFAQTEKQPLPDELLNKRLEFAESVCIDAAVIARRHFRSAELSSEIKGPHDPVTTADLEIDHFILSRIREQFPRDGVLSEELGGAVHDDLWIIDPIDGTANFARGLAHFAISVGFMRGGKVELGVVHNPVTGEHFVAFRGHGAKCNGQKLKVRSPQSASEALIDAGYTSKRPLAEYLAVVDRLLTQGFGFCQLGSAALGLAYTAAGRVDGFCELHLAPWDVAAGLLLVEEAGGYVSDFFAGSGLTEGNGMLACAPGLAPRLREITGIG